MAVCGARPLSWGEGMRSLWRRRGAAAASEKPANFNRLPARDGNWPQSWREDSDVILVRTWQLPGLQSLPAGFGERLPRRAYCNLVFACPDRQSGGKRCGTIPKAMA